MPTIGSVTKTVRIAPKDLEVINGLMADGTSWSGAIHKLCEGVPTGKPQESANSNNDLSEIESMANFFRMGLDEFLKGVCDGLMDGSLTVEGGKVVGVPLVNLEGLEEACHERGISMQDAIDKTVKTLRGNR